MKADRRIIHIDMDCFYAAVEIREHPELADKPVAVGGSSGRGVLTTCNYLARKFGVRSAMPVFQAKKLCPHLITLPVRFELYREASRQIRSIFAEYSPLVEPLSLDEAYLDVSHQRRPGAEIAEEIRRKIEETTRLTASAGVGPNKLVAKIASDWNKPNGQCVVSPSNVLTFMHKLPVRKVWGVGPKSAEKLASLGIHTCGDVQERDETELGQLLGSYGLELYRLAHGIDTRPVCNNRERKSLSTEHTFSENLESLTACKQAIEALHQELREDLNKEVKTRPIHKVFVKLKFSDFRRTTKETIASEPTLRVLQRLLEEAWGRSGESVRLIGVGVRFAPQTTLPSLEQLELDLS